MEDQLAFAHLLKEADERAIAARDLQRGRVQEFFDALSERQKKLLGQWMTETEWDTCMSLSVAACDFHRSTLNGHRSGAGMKRNGR